MVLAAKIITGEMIKANTITGDNIVAGSITGDKLKADTVEANKLTSPGSADYYGVIGKGPNTGDGYGLFLIKNGTTTKDTYLRMYPMADGGVGIQQVVGGVAKGVVYFGANGDSANLSAGNSYVSVSTNDVTLRSTTSSTAYQEVNMTPDKIDLHLWQNSSSGEDVGIAIYKSRGASNEKRIEFVIDGAVPAYINSTGLH